MLKIVAFIFIAGCLTARSGTVHVAYSFADFTTHPLNVARVTVTPLARGADYSGAQLSAAPLIYTKAAYPTLTNGTLTVSNLVAGYAYRVEFADGYGVPAITNYFASGLSGNIDGSTNKGVIISQTGGVVFQFAYYYQYPTNNTALTLTPWASDINAAGYALTNAGSIASTGAVTAASFTGDGSGLTNLPAQPQTPWASDIDAAQFGLTNVGTMQATNVEAGGGLTAFSDAELASGVANRGGIAAGYGPGSTGVTIRADRGAVAGGSFSAANGGTVWSEYGSFAGVRGSYSEGVDAVARNGSFLGLDALEKTNVHVSAMQSVIVGAPPNSFSGDYVATVAVIGTNGDLTGFSTNGFFGNGSGLTNLSLLASNNVFTGTSNHFTGDVGIVGTLVVSTGIVTTLTAGMVIGNGSGLSNTTVIVAASNAPSAVRLAATYVCFGTNDDVVIGAAITNTGAGTVKLSAGNFYLRNAIYPAQNSRIEGSGRFSTVLQPIGGYTNDCMIDVVDRCEILNLQLYGNDTGGFTNGGIWLHPFDSPPADLRFVVEHCYFSHLYKSAIFADQTDEFFLADNAFADNQTEVMKPAVANTKGDVVFSSAKFVYINNNSFVGANSSDIAIQCFPLSDSQINNNNIEAYTYGIIGKVGNKSVGSAGLVSVLGNHFCKCATSIYIYQSYALLVQGNKFGGDVNAPAASKGVYLYDVDYADVSHNQFTSGSSTYANRAMLLESPITRSQFIGNTFTNITLPMAWDAAIDRSVVIMDYTTNRLSGGMMVQSNSTFVAGLQTTTGGITNLSNSATVATNYQLRTPQWVDVPVQWGGSGAGASAPTLTVASASTPVQVFAFDNGDIIYGYAQAPHNIAATNSLFPMQTIEPHVHFSVNGATPDASHSNINWRIEWEIADIGGTYTRRGTNSSTNMLALAASSLNTHYMADFGAITNTVPLGISAIWRCRLMRPALTAQDYSNAHDVLLDSFDVHFPVGNVTILGSREELSQ